jgi:hypothetical protein
MIIILLTLFLVAATTGVVGQATVTLPTNWKNPANDSTASLGPTPIGTKRYPSLVDPNAAGYEFPACVSEVSFGLGYCSINMGYGGVPTTLFAIESSYRYTMQQIGPFLEDRDKQIDALRANTAAEIKLLSDANDALTKRITDLEAKLSKQDQPK